MVIECVSRPPYIYMRKFRVAAGKGQQGGKRGKGNGYG
jgi:hypothetical protein